jgi:hypothetical protein
MASGKAGATTLRSGAPMSLPPTPTRAHPQEVYLGRDLSQLPS